MINVHSLFGTQLEAIKVTTVIKELERHAMRPV